MTDSPKADRNMKRLQWRLFIPLVGSLWIIIGITIVYFVLHETQRQKTNLENRLINVNNTVIDSYMRGDSLQNTVDFIQLFTDNTTLAPLRITVYDRNHRMIADNPEATIHLYDDNGNPNEDLIRLIDGHGCQATLSDMSYDNHYSMVSSKISPDSSVCSLAALPYEDEVLDFLSIDPMIWVVVIVIGIVSTLLSYFGVRAICRNVYQLRDFARAIASGQQPADVDKLTFSDDELGDVSRDLMTLYRDKIHAEQEKLFSERQISLNIRHELNTPLSIIKGYVDTILTDEDMSETLRHRFLVRVQQNTDRLVNLVGDINMLMRLQDNGDQIREVSRFSVAALAARIAGDVAQGHIADNMTLDIDIPSDCQVTAHEPLLSNALINLINNAARHSGGSRMSLRWVGCDGQRHKFVFADNGCGVDPEHIGRIFDLFYRVDSGRSRKSGGSGLGLPLVRRIITAMGGDISVSNASGGGLEFTFTLPV